MTRLLVGLMSRPVVPLDRKAALLALVLACGVLQPVGPAMAAEDPAKGGGTEVTEHEAPIPERQPWSFAGFFGKYDTAQLQRGFRVFREVCSNCHSANDLAFRNLADAGGPQFSEGQVKALAAEYKVKDGPNDAGDMFDRPRTLRITGRRRSQMPMRRAQQTVAGCRRICPCSPRRAMSTTPSRNSSSTRCRSSPIRRRPRLHHIAPDRLQRSTA